MALGLFKANIVNQQLRKQLPIGIRGAKEAVAQWAILRSRKRPERVNRSKQRVEASAMPAAPTEIAANDLLSRTVASQVPSALKSLTSVFGMGTGGTSSSLPPEMVSYLGNRFSFCPLGLPYQRFHRPFIGTVWPLPSSFSSSSGALGRFTHPDNCTATIFRKI